MKTKRPCVFPLTQDTATEKQGKRKKHNEKEKRKSGIETGRDEHKE